ncbi:S1 family peptidase [Methylocapsa acidiphila]|uniref:S1 family peptidase n=1 Tax=Methylocapsa acidiphila TaxID=133552 RepID=UPI00040FB415|nr:serine protease [Methylocapsa acidiphila]
MARENRFFLLSSDLTGCVAVTHGGRAAAAQYGDFIARLEAVCGRDAAELFAEPMLPRGSPGSAAISWYGPLEGRPVEIDSIDAVARKPVADMLSRRLEALASAFADAQLEPLILACLNVASSRDVVAVGGEPILVNWGYLPQDIADDPARRLEHFSRTLGRFAPKLIPLAAAGLGVSSSEAAPEAAPQPPATASTAPQAETPAAPLLARKATTPAPIEFNQLETAPAGRAPLVAAAIAAVLLLVLLLPGVLAYPHFGDQAARDEFEAQRLRASNESLEAQLKALRKADETGVCRADNSAPVPEMGDPSKPAPNMELLPKPPDKAALPAKPGEPAQAATIAQLLEKSVVYVFVLEKGDKASTGTGFFISPTQLITNRHVVEDALDDQFIFIGSKALNGARLARVVAKTPPRQEDVGPQSDFAVLELAKPADVEALKLGPAPPKLSTAYIAGYPGFLVHADSDRIKFIEGLKEALQRGETDEQLAARRFNVPSVDLRYGRINNVMSSGLHETPIIVHDMQVAHGNSGGPLIDGCGRLGGVNTAFLADEHQVGNVALSVVALRKFLTDLHISFTADDTSCGPTTTEARPETPTPPAPSPSPK